MRYTYGCETCGKIFENRLSVSDMMLPTEQKCPYCDNMTVKKLMDVPNIHWEFAGKTKQNPVNEEEIYKKQLNK